MLQSVQAIFVHATDFSGEAQEMQRFALQPLTVCLGF